MPIQVPYWTIQPYSVYAKLQAKGFITGPTKYDYEHDPYFTSDKTSSIFIKPYEWMSEQMVTRLVKPYWYDSNNPLFPLWAWYQYKDHLHKRPDLRSTGYLSKGSQGVLIEFRADPSTVLLSNFDDWHFVLNNWYLGQNNKDDGDFSRRFYEAMRQGDKIELESCKKIIRESWSRIFIGDSAKQPKSCIQATLWRLELSQVVKIRHFVAR